jgi:hypothetical protein
LSARACNPQAISIPDQVIELELSIIALYELVLLFNSVFIDTGIFVV